MMMQFLLVVKIIYMNSCSWVCSTNKLYYIKLIGRISEREAQTIEENSLFYRKGRLPNKKSVCAYFAELKVSLQLSFKIENMITYQIAYEMWSAD